MPPRGWRLGTLSENRRKKNPARERIVHAKLMHAIELLGTRVAPLVRAALASEKVAAPSLKNAPAAALKTN
jgi:hypothetical protein